MSPTVFSFWSTPFEQHLLEGDFGYFAKSNKFKTDMAAFRKLAAPVPNPVTAYLIIVYGTLHVLVYGAGG